MSIEDFTKELKVALEATRLGEIISDITEADEDYILVDIGPLEIPQYPVANVRSVERVRIKVIENNIPLVFCRDDFPVVPHLNIMPDGSKTLCLYDVSYEEVKYFFNATIFLKRIVYWFEKTAKGQLHEASQPLEPYFPGVRDELILLPNNKIPFIRLKDADMEGRKLYQQIQLSSKNEGTLYIYIPLEIERPYSENIINHLPRTIGELDTAFSENIVTKIDEAIPKIWGVRGTQYYQDLFSQTENNLRRAPVIIAVKIKLAREKNAEPESYCYKAFLLQCNFQSLYKSLGYKKDGKGKLYQSDYTEEYKSINLLPLEVYCAFSQEIALLLNGQDIVTTDSFVQVGLGSLGSQVAQNCLRSGFGKWVYIDPDILYPHNLARHILGQKWIGKNKAKAMLEYAQELYTGTDCMVSDGIPADILDPTERIKLINTINSADLIVDCSASVSAARYLSSELAGDTRIVSFFLNPTGSSLVMILESADRQCDLIALEMQYYRMLIRKPELSGHLESPRRVLYSSSCRGASMVYSQDNVALFASICSKALKRIKAFREGVVSIWSLDDLELNHYEEQADIFQEIKCDGGWHVKVSNFLLKEISEKRECKLPYETGGVLIGTYDFHDKTCYIVDAIDSPEDSKEYPNAYIRGSRNLLDKVEKIQEITVGNLTYIGEWHSHPGESVSASADDFKLLSSIATYQLSEGNPGCMLIVGESHTAVYMKSL